MFLVYPPNTPQMKLFFTTSVTCLFFLLLPGIAQPISLSASGSLRAVLVYPNPFNDTFTVESTDKNLNIDLFTLGGQRLPVTLYRHHRGERVLYQTGRELSRGLYLVRLQAGAEVMYYKLMKTN